MTLSFYSSVFTQNEKDLSFGFDNDFYTKYVWRGLINYDQTVYQPSLWISYKNLGLAFFANINISEEENISNLNEMDVTLSYGNEFSVFGIESGVLYYYYPLDKESGELFFNLSATFKNIALSTNSNLDIIKYPGSFSNESGLTFSVDASENILYSLKLGLGISNSDFNKAYSGLDKFAINQFFLNQSLDYFLNDNFSITPKIEISMPVEKELKKINGEASILNFGLGISYQY
jgi:hypothetical protein